MNLSIIIPTKNRPYKIKTLLKILTLNKFFFNEILIIDSSNEKYKNILKKITKKFSLKIKFYTSYPSISKQRNIGIKKMNKKNKYYMFLDDDILFQNKSFKIMSNFIKKNTSYSGYSFNILTRNKKNIFDNLKKNFFFEKFGIYSVKPGSVSSSGWHSKLENLKENLEVDWLPTNAVIYKKNDKIYFDEFFSEYSYLEDLDFSYRKRKFGKLIVLKDAPCYNYNFIERKNFSFGVKELVNRYYFVKKNKLNIISFFFTSILKALSNLIRINLSQFTGNIIGLLKICLDYFLFKKL